MRDHNRSRPSVPLLIGAAALLLWLASPQPRAGAGPLAAGPLPAIPSWQVSGEQAASGGITRVAPAGDVNGDGLGDLLVSAYGWSSQEDLSVGRVALYYGAAGGLATTPARVYSGAGRGARLGYDLAGAGDLNGDGFGDMVLGSFTSGDDGEPQPFAQIYYGSADGPGALPDRTLTGEPGSYFGAAVGGAGDVNGDGFDDLMVSAPMLAGAGGAISIYHGSPQGIGAAPTAQINSFGGPDRFFFFGSAVEGAGDVNGDGYADILVGSVGWDEERGRADLYLGSAGGVALGSSWHAEGTGAMATYGQSVGGAGDVNGDGFADIIIGEPRYRSAPQGPEEGKAYVYYGGAAGLPPAGAPSWSYTTGGGARLGNSVSTAGDINADGYADVIVGAPTWAPDDEQAEPGAAFVFLGSPAGLGPSPAWSSQGSPLSGYGMIVATAGDVDGNGLSEILITAPLIDSFQHDTGVAFLFGGSAPQPPPRQSQSISFAALPDRRTTDPPFALTATASSGLPVSYTAGGSCSVSAGQVTLSGAEGLCTIRATQIGDDAFNPASPVERSFLITNPAKQSQSISFAALPDRRTTDSPFTLSATASSGLAVSYSAVGACSVAGATLTLQGAGTCTVTASQAGDASFNPAPPVSRSFTVRAGYRLYLPLLQR